MNEKPIAIGWFGPTHDQWEWILSRFRDVSLLTHRNIEEWTRSKSNSTKPHGLSSSSALLFAVESRFDPDLAFFKSIEGNLHSLPYCMLLGDDWVGHRRTHPLPESLQTFYWYELFDRLMPWLRSSPTVASQISTAEPSNTANQRRVSPRVQRLIDASVSIERSLSDGNLGKTLRQALIVSETAVARQLWLDVLSQRDIQCVATTPDNLRVWCDPNVIVIDLECEPLLSRELGLQSGEADRTVDLVVRLARQFPQAMLVVTDAFPRWVHWNDLAQSGADLIVAKPFQPTGILETLVHSSL